MVHSASRPFRMSSPHATGEPPESMYDASPQNHRMDDAERRAAIRDYIERDPFARSLGAVIEALEPGYCRASLTVSPAMINFHGTTHGAVVFALADIALAGASNSGGQTTFALSINVAFLATTAVGDRLVAEAREEHASGPTGLYDLIVRREGTGEGIARAQAMTYRKKEWFVPPGGGA